MIKFTVICKSKHWPARVKKITSIIKKILKFKKDLKFKQAINYNCNIILADNNLVKKINYKFRKKNQPTDVLTFVSEVRKKNIQKFKICDIFISAEIIKKDAKRNNTTFYDHFTHILIHSFLHINGFNHIKNKDYYQMKEREVLILKKLGIINSAFK
ncbi:rRNA maturation RNase YbeY [Alphaproteobacteria bacterium]|nr:rRNA maturation RNase YbeY [Alphaproteobacteria bacterium]